MALARRRHDWEQTANLLSLIYNINRDSKKSPARGPDDFNPFARPKQKAKLEKISIKDFYQMLTSSSGRDD